MAQEFTAGLRPSTKSSKDVGAEQDSRTRSFNVPFPTLTPSAGGELYFGCACVSTYAGARADNGVTCEITADYSVCFDPSVPAALSPVGVRETDDASASIAVLHRAST